MSARLVKPITSAAIIPSLSAIDSRRTTMRLLAGIILLAWVGTALCAETPPSQKTIGINLAYRNLSVKPGDDFEEYANGG
jgi:hypothetical protein